MSFTIQTTPLIKPAEATIKTLIYSVLEGDATIDETGLLTVNSSGRIVTQAQATDGTGTLSQPLILYADVDTSSYTVDYIINGDFYNPQIGFEGATLYDWKWWSINGSEVGAPTIENNELTLRPMNYDGMGTTFWAYNLFQDYIGVKNGTTYNLSFDMRSETGPCTIKASFQDPNNGYARIASSTTAGNVDGRAEWYINLTTDLTSYTYEATFDLIIGNTVVDLKFEISSTDQLLYLSNIKLI